MTWTELKIGELGKIVTGKTPSTKVSEYFGGQYPFVTPSDIDYGHYYVRSTETTVTEQAKNKYKNQFIPKDSVLFTCIGNTMGKCAITSQECISNQQMNAVVANSEHDPKFLYYLLHHYRNLVRGIGMGGGAATPIINKTTFSNIKLRVPSEKSTQKAISSLLENYDDLIENNMRRIELLEESARQLFKEWFVRFRFPGHEHVKIIDGVPEGWEKTTAEQVVKILSGGTPKTTFPDYWDGDIGFYTPKDSANTVYVSNTEKTITELGLEKCASKLYPKDTLFITARGTVGKLNLAQKPMAMNQSCYALVGKEPVNQIYLFFAMQAGIQQVKSRAVGAVFDAIIKDTFKVIPFVVPPERLIEEFTDYAESILKQIDCLLISIEKLTQARDILLPKLMNGEIAV